MKLPSKLRAGDKLSATWLNSLRDALSSLAASSARNKILKGAGYNVSESSGGTSLSIAKQSELLRDSYSLPLHRNNDFALRIKPKELCELSDEGEWQKMLQVHTGSIRNSTAEHILVNSYDAGADGGGADGEAEPEDVQPWDSEDWIDIQALAEEPIEVFVRYDGSKGEFVSKKEDDSNIYIPIGVLEIEKLNGVSQYYITQYHLGSIELGAGKAMPFDACIKLCKHECDVAGGDFPLKPKYLVSVEEGRIFLPEAKHTIIPKKDATTYGSGGVLEAQNGYLLLEVFQKADGTIEYKYRIATDLPGTALEATEMTPPQA